MSEDLGARWAAIRQAGLCPPLNLILTRVFRRQIFIDVDSQPRFVAGIHVSVTNFGHTGEDFIHTFRGSYTIPESQSSVPIGRGAGLRRVPPARYRRVRATRCGHRTYWQMPQRDAQESIHPSD